MLKWLIKNRIAAFEREFGYDASYVREVRWTDVDRDAVAESRGYLARTVSRLCLDRMKSARAHREHYVGTWLPEPLVDDDGAAGSASFAGDLSVALLLTLERLSPLERAAFLLHDVFDMDYADIAGVLDRSEPACRQLAARGRDTSATSARAFRRATTTARGSRRRFTRRW